MGYGRSLVSLPNELVEFILCYLDDPEDFLKLRRSCWDMYAFVDARVAAWLRRRCSWYKVELCSDEAFFFFTRRCKSKCTYV